MVFLGKDRSKRERKAQATPTSQAPWQRAEIPATGTAVSSILAALVSLKEDAGVAQTLPLCW